MSKKKLNELTEEDIDIVLQYPKVIGEYKNHKMTLHIGIHSIYMKYNDRNYKLDSTKEYSFPNAFLSAALGELTYTLIVDVSIPVLSNINL